MLMGQVCGQFPLPDLDMFRASLKAMDRDGELPLIKSTLEDLAEAQRYGSRAEEHRCHVELAEIAFHLQDWIAAYGHGQSVIALSDEFDGGTTPYNTPRNRKLRFIRYGIVNLRVRLLSNALACFYVGQCDTESQAWSNESDPYNLAKADTPAKFVSAALLLSRMSVLEFTTSEKLTPDEFYELDNIVQELIPDVVRERWPECNINTVASTERLSRWFEVTSDDDGKLALVPALHRESLLDRAVGFLSYRLRVRPLRRFATKTLGNTRIRSEIRDVEKWQQQQLLQETEDLDLSPLRENILLYCAGRVKSEQEPEEPLQQRLEHILLHGGLMA